MRFENKKILIVSPQEWSDFMISKHHYARELALAGNEVYFLNPPNKYKNKIEIIEHGEISNLFIVKYGLVVSSKFRFHLRWLFNFFIYWKVRSICKSLGKNIDILWCFEPNLFSNLRWFGAELTIYHPVDFLNYTYQIEPARTADIVFSVAENILSSFNKIETPKFLVNHGLSEYYSEKDHKDNNIFQGDQIKFAYVGSLLIQGLDQQSLKEVISQYPNIQFDFYGKYQYEDSQLSDENTFVDFLLSRNNCNVKGLYHPKQLSEAIHNYDGFIICYRPDEELNSGSNSHKILEYLSTGKMIISNRILAYEKFEDLILMAKESDNSDYIGVFEEGVNNIEKYNKLNLQERRRKFALNNTYIKQIRRIEELITTNLSKE